MKARFGPAGNSDSFIQNVSRASVDAPGWLNGLGLDAYEYQSGKGVNIKRETAEEIGQQAKTHGIALSLHAPYFTNQAKPLPESLKKNKSFVLDSCRAADWMGATRIIVHTGTLLKRTRRQALDTAIASMRDVIATCDEEGYGHIEICPETMGKIGQLGDLDEVLELCELDERLVPCVDFGHLYARSLGAMEGEEATAAILDRIAEVLGQKRAARFHGHFSKIEFTPKGGEKMHLTFDQDDFGPDYNPLVRQLALRGWGPTIICESKGTQAEDALIMKRAYEKYLKKGGRV